MQGTFTLVPFLQLQGCVMYTSQPTHFPHMRSLRLAGWGLRAFIQGLTWLGLHLGA